MIDKKKLSGYLYLCIFLVQNAKVDFFFLFLLLTTESPKKWKRIPFLKILSQHRPFFPLFLFFFFFFFNFTRQKKLITYTTFFFLFIPLFVIYQFIHEYTNNIKYISPA